jgi:HK97 family phage prohead protease
MNEIITERLPLGEVDQSRCDELAAEQGCKPSELEFIRKGFVAESKGTDDDERSSTELISTASVDRDNEILMPKGVVLEHFRKNPQVLWAHDYRQPPIGKAAWVKKDTGSKGLLAKTIYATTDFAEEIWKLIKGKFLPARSVGFIPIESHEPDEREITRNPERTGARRIYDKWELLEYSVVPVPSNREALQQAVGKDISLSVDLQEQLGLDMDEAICKNLDRKDIDYSTYTDAELDFAASLGLGPRAELKPSKKYKCPKCGKANAYYREIHPDTSKNAIVLCCPDCGFRDELEECQNPEPAPEKQQTTLVSLPSKVKNVIAVPRVRRVISIPKNVLDIRRNIAIVVKQEIDRARGRI